MKSARLWGAIKAACTPGRPPGLRCGDRQGPAPCPRYRICCAFCCAVLPGVGRTNHLPKIPLDGRSPPFFPSSCTEPLRRPLRTHCRAPTLHIPPTPLAPTPHLLLSALFFTVLFVYESFCLPEDPSAGVEGRLTTLGTDIRGTPLTRGGWAAV